MDVGSARLQPQTAVPAGHGTETGAGPLKPRGKRPVQWIHALGAVETPLGAASGIAPAN
jgi:hypothetical protein